MGILFDNSCKWLRKDGGLKEPMDKFALFFIFLVGSYFPSLILSIVHSLFFKKPTWTVDPVMYQYNQ